MADCPCIHTPQSGSFTTTTSNVSYDGVATCSGFSSGNLNAVIAHITDLICNINSTLSGLAFDTNDITIGGISPTCVPKAGMTNLSEWLNAVEAYVCGLQSAISGITVDDVGGTFDCSCIGGGANEDLRSTLEALISFLCDINDIIDDNIDDIPILPFIYGNLAISDESALMTPKVRIDADTYWINGKEINKLTTVVTLVSNKDNYIYIDKSTDDFAVMPVGIGDPTPVTNGGLICVVTTGLGVVNSIVPLISNNPFDGALIVDNSINATKFNGSCIIAPLKRVGTDITFDYNSNNFEISGGKLEIKNNGINSALLIDNNVLAPSIQKDMNGQLSVMTKDSVELDGVDGRVKLKNDNATPGNNKRYGTDVAGVKGWVTPNEWLVKEITLSKDDILDLYDTPFKLLECPAIVGFNTAICIHKVVLTSSANGTEYSDTHDLEIRYGTEGSKVTADVSEKILSNNTQTIYAVNSTASTALEFAKDIYIMTTVENPTTGDKELKVRIYYTVESVSVGF